MYANMYMRPIVTKHEDLRHIALNQDNCMNVCIFMREELASDIDVPHEWWIAADPSEQFCECPS